MKNEPPVSSSGPGPSGASPLNFLQSLLGSIRPPDWVVDELQNRLVLFLNHVLMQEPAAQDRLRRQKGKPVRVQWGDFHLTLAPTRGRFAGALCARRQARAAASRSPRPRRWRWRRACWLARSRAWTSRATCNWRPRWPGWWTTCAGMWRKTCPAWWAMPPRTPSRGLRARLRRPSRRLWTACPAAFRRRSLRQRTRVGRRRAAARRRTQRMTRLFRGAFIVWVVLRYGLDELVLSSFQRPWHPPADPHRLHRAATWMRRAASGCARRWSGWARSS